MNEGQVELTNYPMPPLKGFAIAPLAVIGIERPVLL